MINANTQAILLLTAHFSKASGEAKPLSPGEWGRFALWLNERGSTPAQLLGIEPLSLLQGWTDTTISLARIEHLLARGHALALAMEKWSRAGIWVLTRSDADYPWQLKKYLKTDAPPVLFGCGNAKLLNQRGVAVVGSRSAVDTDLAFTRMAGQAFADAGVSVVSGGARGVDEAAMLGCLEAEGTVCGVMADSLLKAVTSAKWRSGLMNNNLVLISPFHPEAAFNAGNAMARNKYIYCLSQAALVVHSGMKGGTWNGAVENLKHGWVPMWVKPTTDPDAGNAALVMKGGVWCGEGFDELVAKTVSGAESPALPADHLLSDGKAGHAHDERGAAAVGKPATHSPRELTAVNEQIGNYSVKNVETKSADLPVNPSVGEPAALEIPTTSLQLEHTSELSFYQFFLKRLELIEKPSTADFLAEHLGLPKSLVTQWLTQGVEEGVVEKLSKPVRYQLRSANQLGLGLG